MSKLQTALSTRITRRAAIAGGLAAIAAPYVARSALAKASELRLLVWEGYADDAWVKPFEAKAGVKLKITYVGSADEMFAKMKGSNGADFDVVTFDTSAFARYIDANLLQPIAVDKIPNASHLAPAFQSVAPIMRGDKRYGLPFAWGSLPLVYNKADFPKPPESWEVMWDPQYAQQMISQDDANNMITLGAIVLGIKDPFALTDEQFEAIKKKLIEQKKLLLTYYAGFDDGVNIFAQSGIKLMYSMGEPQVPSLKKKGIDAAFTIPKEGAIGWLDCWTISVGAKDVDLANAWLNACLEKPVGDFLSDKEGYGNTTSEEANQRNGLTYGDKLVWLKTPENIEKRVKVWNEVKAAS
jgi:spermidine/putrescine-binding protein